MSRFRIPEKVSNQAENLQPKAAPSQTTFQEQLAKKRAPLQQLCVQPQKPKEHQEENPPKKTESKLVPSEFLKLKPVFRKRLLRFQPSEALEYEDAIWKYLYHLEKKTFSISPNYMSKQMHLSWDMRMILVDWLVSVGDEYKMNENTIHLSVNYLDRFLSNISVIREKFQLVGATAMMIAGKMDEIYPPDTKEWSYLSGDAFTVRQFLKMEQLMLKILDFQLNPPTTLEFLRHLCVKHNIDNKTMYLAMYLSELVLLEGRDYLKYFPSQLAAASLLLARHTLSKPKVWTKQMEEVSGYSVKQLSPVVQKQHSTFKSSPFREQQAIQKKYASDKYQKVALLKPRVLVLEEEE